MNMEKPSRWVYEQVQTTCSEHSVTNEELMKKLAIQKIEWARTVLASYFARFSYSKRGAEIYIEGDIEMQRQIRELGGEPIQLFKYKTDSNEKDL